ncbi:hypothetical protein SAMN04487886_10838 [Clostridium sp. DSM 8431]|nr:hypothetical protein SAMN04487886_10838 [Clostridium sp. DSM 8431]
MPLFLIKDNSSSISFVTSSSLTKGIIEIIVNIFVKY